MKAAPYRFYRHCTIDEDGIMTCHAGSGSELNISAEVFEFADLLCLAFIII